MAYNRESFLAGLAVGRAMWRPPMQTGEVPVEVRWTADPEYLVYDADLWLCRVWNYLYNFTYTKLYSGKAIAVFGAGYAASGSVWYGPILISPDYYSVYTNQSGGMAGTVQYGGATWYYSDRGAITEFGSIIGWETNLVEFGPDEGPDRETIVLKILEQANARVFVGG